MPKKIEVNATAEGESKDKHVEVPDAMPTAETFDLDDFVQEKATVPVVAVTVFLDADAGKQLYEAQMRQEELNSAEVDLNNSTSPKLAVGEVNPKMVKLDDIRQELSSLGETIAGLEGRVRSSALLVELQISDHKMPERVRGIIANAMSGQQDEAELSEKAMTATLAEATVRIMRTDGAVIKGPVPVEKMKNLREKLVVTESTKLVQGLYEALNLNVQWMANVDAGFPGRDSDVAG
jgi:hypothetical protein